MQGCFSQLVCLLMPSRILLVLCLSKNSGTPTYDLIRIFSFLINISFLKTVTEREARPKKLS